MKTVKYSVSANDEATIKQLQSKYVAENEADYAANPTHYGSRQIDELRELWKHNGSVHGIFTVLEQDGLAHIEKHRDEFYTFADHAGDCFDPEVNSDIAPAELKRREKRERARFNRHGVWYHVLTVLGGEVEHGCIGGFVHRDFWGSGYDTEFYEMALEEVEAKMPEYAAELKLAAGL